MTPPSRDSTSESDLDLDYKTAGFSKRLGFGRRPALVVIDFCHAYLDADSPLYAGVEDARASSERLLRASRAAGIPIIHTRVEFQPDGANGGVFFRKVDALKCFIEGNPLGEPGPGVQAGPARLRDRRADPGRARCTQHAAADQQPAQSGGPIWIRS